ncbi:hypothetical protein MNBD_BACTEROID05-1201, partial [hydrothermal vent metagenome]
MRTRLIKKITFLSILFLGVVSFPQNSFSIENNAPIKVLFIGNSYIYVNDLPDMFSKVVRSSGREVVVKTSANPAWKLMQHAKSQTTLSMIGNEDWDYIVLQEQSTLPLFASNLGKFMIPATRILQEKAQQSGAKIILFMTWGRRDGFKRPGMQNYEQMQEKLSNAYLKVANDLQIMVAPIGVAWQNLLKENLSFSLWQGDGSHPSREGTYAAVCVLYSVIFDQSPLGIEYKGWIDSTKA